MTTGSGCWTCRVRRKKCDGIQPVCDTCAALYITCHSGPNRPAWMDGGARQDEMAERLKREVRVNGPRRREKHVLENSGERRSQASAVVPDLQGNGTNAGHESSALCSQPNYDGMAPIKDECIMTSSGWTDNVLLMFYLDSVFPFLFPLYQPSVVLEGGRAWILEMVIKSPAIRKALICQGSLFFVLMQRKSDHEPICETMLGHAGDAFAELRRALQVRLESPVPEHPHCSVRLMASIMQLQRFEVATQSFENCQQHLNAALELFQRLLDTTGTCVPNKKFSAVLQSLQSSSWDYAPQPVRASCAEQAAFRFSSALLILDDMVASTVLQEPPKLYEYHEGILGYAAGTGDPLNLEAIFGCQNWVFLELGKIVALDAWKQRCKRAGNLDVVELVHRAKTVRDALQDNLKRLATDPFAIPVKTRAMLDKFTTGFLEQSLRSVSQISVITRVWAHAALIYLSIVVSGWQANNLDVRYHVDRVIELSMHQLEPQALLRTIVWPFCVAGCLAEPAQEDLLRSTVTAMQPPSVFGTLNKALDIMENVWRNRNSGGAASRDLAACFRSQGELVLLI